MKATVAPSLMQYAVLITVIVAHKASLALNMVGDYFILVDKMMLPMTRQ